MKKITFALLSIFLVVPCMANIHINSEIVAEVVAKHFPNKRLECIREYNAQVKASNGAGIAASKLWNVCAAGGLDIKQSADKEKCRKFVNELVKSATVKYYEVCGQHKGKTGGTEYCINNIFTNKVYGGIQVNESIGEFLSKEYAIIKHGDSSLQCSKKIRETKVMIGAPEYFIKCASKNKNAFYEFQFDDLKESMDSQIRASTTIAICEKLYGQKMLSMTPFQCKTDEQTCKSINATLQRMGHFDTAKYKNNSCEMHISEFVSNLRNDFSDKMDSLDFCRGAQTQLRSDGSLESLLKQYVAKKVGVSTSNVSCEVAGARRYKGGTCNGSLMDPADDVITCFVGKKQIDFVFDDINEYSKKLQKGSIESMNCVAENGIYQGADCLVPNKETCDLIAKATLRECPECAHAYFDTSRNSCILPNATIANNQQKKINVGLIIGGTVVGAVIIVATGGTTAAVVLMGLETLGATMEVGAQLHIDGIADEFFVKANNCKSASCAENIVKEYFQYLSRMTRDLTPAEKNAIDTRMAQLIEMLPNNSQFLIDVVAGCYEENTDGFDISKCDDDVWNEDQIIRAVGIGLQFTSVFTSVGKWILGANRVKKIAQQTPRMIQALQRKIPGVKDAIIKSADSGKELKASGGKDIVRRIFKRSDVIQETEQRIGKLLDDIFRHNIGIPKEQAKIEQDFIIRNKGMLFHGSATDYKEGKVEALSTAWQVPPGEKWLFATSDFNIAKRYAADGKPAPIIKRIDFRIPQKIVEDKNLGHGWYYISDNTRPYGYVYAVKPDGFGGAGVEGYLKITHTVDRVDRIKVPLYEDYIFVKENAFAGLDIDNISEKISNAVSDINDSKNVLKNLEIYEDGLKQLKDILK